MNDQSYKKILVFLVLTFALSSIFYYLVISTNSFTSSYGLGIMWCPGIAAIITQLIFLRSLRGLSWKPKRGNTCSLDTEVQLSRVSEFVPAK